MTDAKPLMPPPTPAPEHAGPRGGAAGLWVRVTRGSELWQHADFLRLWGGQAISQVGSQITLVALPLIAVERLHATASVMGVIGAVGRLPFVLYLVAGVWVDRVRRRRVLLGADLARGALLLVIPLSAAAHALSLWLLGAVLFAVMTLSVWFDTAYMSYLPSLVDRRLLMQGNSVMESTRSGAQVVGPSLGGILVAALSAPAAIVADAVSFFVSAFSLWRIRRPEPKPEPERSLGVGGMFSAIGVGLKFVAKDRTLGPLALAIGVSNLVWAAELALYIIYLAKGLGLPAELIGLALAAAGPGALAGSALAGKIQRKIGVSGAITGGLALFAVSALLIPAAPAHHEALATGMLMVAGLGMSAGGQVCVVNVMTTRQMMTPDHLLGRVNASFRFIGLGVSPLGSLLGGALGAILGLRLGLLVAVLGMFLAPVIVLASPVRRVRVLPSSPPGEATTGSGQS
ncbi:MAG TPA: MFS transporter [Streptosporangiaceae bacterium]|nr:MFS transporter [Streptosporangiaceae bacterium]